MNKQFDVIPINAPKRNVFDLSHEVKMTFNMGELIPFLCLETVPGDTFICDSEVLIRFAPMLAPIMHRVDVYTHFFFVPNRIIWDEWEDFITGGEDGLDATAIPTITINQDNKEWFEKGRLPDYLGIPPIDPLSTVDGEIEINALPFKAYLEIYNEYYRDQNLIDEVGFSWGTVATTVRKRAWERDYFTSALPWTQRGSEVELPLGISAPIETSSAYVEGIRKVGGALPPDNGALKALNGTLVDVNDNGLYWKGENWSADLSSATAATVNELRRAIRIQEWLEKSARGGSRYAEQILIHFGVKSSDARLQRPEYLGGGKQNVVISEVLNTAVSRSTAAGTVDQVLTPQGEMTGHAISIGKSNEFKAYFEEHGYVIGIISVMPKTAYQEGIPKMFSREDKFDFYFPEFAQLGEQEIKMKELVIDYEDNSDRDTVFGYQSRYVEYKQQPSRVAGDMRDDYAHWHLGRIFGAGVSNVPLNQSFIECNPSHRIFAVTDPDIDKVICQIYNKVKAIRPMPYFNVPTI